MINSKNISVLIFSVFVAISQQIFAKAELSSVKVGSKDRSYLVRVPDLCLKQACPLVLVFHGGMGSGEQIEKHSGFTPLAEQEGFIVVYPNGLNKQWNDGRKGQNDDVDDMAFIDQLLEDVKAKHKVDEKKIFSTGMSNGGFFSFRLACERSKIFAAIAPVAANHSVGVVDKCNPDQPVSVLNIVGTEDKAVPYKGGSISVLLGIRKRGQVLSSDESIKSWVKINSCKDSAVISDVDEIKDDQTSVKIEKYTEQCKNKTQVVRMNVVGGGHTWPGRLPNHRGFFHKSVTSMEIDATQEIWNFFKLSVKAN
jgi:polyhydroxybutyrate depolymerase